MKKYWILVQNQNRCNYILSLALVLISCGQASVEYGSTNPGSTIESPVTNVTAINLVNNQLTISGQNLNSINSIKIENDEGLSAPLTVTDQIGNSVSALAPSPLYLTFGLMYRLVLSDASAQTVVPFTFTPGNSSITPAMLDRSYLSVDASGNVGIGTTSPGAKLVVSANTSGLQAPLSSTVAHFANSDSSATRVLIDGYGVGGSTETFRTALGTAASPSSVVSGTSLGSINWFGYGTTGYSTTHRALFTASAAENWTDSAQGTYMAFSTTSTGSTTDTERMRIDSTGNVGIGTTSPTQPLVIASNNSSFDVGRASMSIQTNNNAHSWASSWIGLGRSRGTSASPSVPLSGDATGAISGTSFTGIGTGIGGYSANSTIVFKSDGTTSSTSSPGMIELYTVPDGTTTGVARLVIRNDGNVGIGTTAPAAKLQVAGNGIFGRDEASSTYIMKDFTTAHDVANGTASMQFGMSDGGGVSGMTILNTRTGSLNSQEIGFFTAEGGISSATERMRITKTGNVGIGLANPSYKLDVSGDVNASGCVRAGGSTLGGTCSSDERLKSEVQHFDLGLDALLGISPKTFKYNGLGGRPASNQPELGVIAQEIEKVAPELVVSKEGKLHPNDQNTTEIKHVNYTAFTYVLINAVKDLYHRWFDDSQEIHRDLASKADKTETAALKIQNEKLKQENAEIKARLERLEKALSSR